MEIEILRTQLGQQNGIKEKERFLAQKFAKVESKARVV